MNFSTCLGACRGCHCRRAPFRYRCSTANCVPTVALPPKKCPRGTHQRTVGCTPGLSLIVWTRWGTISRPLSTPRASSGQLKDRVFVTPRAAVVYYWLPMWDTWSWLMQTIGSYLYVQVLIHNSRTFLGLILGFSFTIRALFVFAFVVFHIGLCSRVVFSVDLW